MSINYVSVLDRQNERLFSEYGEQWSLIFDTEECNKRISEFFKRSNLSILAYLSKEGLYFQEFKENILREEIDKKIIYHNKSLTFIVGNENNILIKDGNQLFIKYHSKILGKRFSERFYALKDKIQSEPFLF